MKIPRILLLGAVGFLTLSILFTASGTSYTSKKAHATSCTVYVVGSPVLTQDANASFVIYLMYSTCGSQNFTLVQVTPTGGAPAPVAILQRATGPDGGEMTVQRSCYVSTTTYCTSPGLYSPDNLARACLTDSGDPNMPKTCTSWY